MQEIHDSIVNGQFKQAAAQITEYSALKFFDEYSGWMRYTMFKGYCTECNTPAILTEVHKYYIKATRIYLRHTQDNWIEQQR